VVELWPSFGLHRPDTTAEVGRRQESRVGRPRIVDVDYYEFKNQLAKAMASNGRVERRDGERWTQYLRQHKVNEASMMHWGRSKFDKVEAVIIDCGSDWDGFYVYSVDQEAALKWVRDPD
jgi:hypothetical protein